MVTEFISPSFNTSRKILFLYLRMDQKSHSSIDNLTQSNDFNQEWTSLRFESVHPNYWIIEREKKRLNYKLHFLTLFKIQLCLLTLLWFNLVLLVSILFNLVSLLAFAKNVLLMTLKLCSFFFSDFLYIKSLIFFFLDFNLNIRSIG